MGILTRIKDLLVGGKKASAPAGARPKKRIARQTGKRAPTPSAPSARHQVDSQRAVARALLAYQPPPSPRTKPGVPTLTRDWVGFPRADARFIEENPNAFLFGVIMDRMMEANQAWLGVARLARRLGHLDVAVISNMGAVDLAGVLGRWKGEKSLHRFPPTMAKHLIAASRRLVAQFDGDASNIWARDPGARVVLDRLLEFDGISDKLANMAARILVTSYGVKLSGWEHIDVAVDRHVARVFLRTGLVDGSAAQRVYRVVDVREDVVTAARRLLPHYPGALDEPAFLVGKYWCTTERAWCADGERPCPLARACSRTRTTWNIQG